jgi:hypothetical protein
MPAAQPSIFYIKNALPTLPPVPSPPTEPSTIPPTNPAPTVPTAKVSTQPLTNPPTPAEPSTLPPTSAAPTIPTATVPSSQPTLPTPPIVPPTTTQLAQWVAVGGLKITDPTEVAAILTASYSRTPAQKAIIANLTKFITEKVKFYLFY